MKCRICKNKMRETRTASQHVHEVSPIDKGLCTGCWMATVDLQMFLIRANDQTVMGAWPEGWLREIIKDPKRYLA